MGPGAGGRGTPAAGPASRGGRSARSPQFPFAHYEDVFAFSEDQSLEPTELRILGWRVAARRAGPGTGPAVTMAVAQSTTLLSGRLRNRPVGGRVSCRCG